MLNISLKQRTDCGNVRGVEVVLGEANDQTCFANSAVPDEQQFEEEIILFRHDRSCSSQLKQI